MKIVAALTDPAEAGEARAQGADLIELRFDLMEGDPVRLLQEAREECDLPVIATFRSIAEGGRYAGTADDWLRAVTPLIPLADYVDVEQRFSQHAGVVRATGKQVIASYHTGGMPGMYELFDLERYLRTYGDIVKIIATPQNREDVIELITFTGAVKQPICTGVMGSGFRYARAILPLFGSCLVYCSVGRPTAAGQYSVAGFRALQKLLTG